MSRAPPDVTQGAGHYAARAAPPGMFAGTAPQQRCLDTAMQVIDFKQDVVNNMLDPGSGTCLATGYTGPYGAPMVVMQPQQAGSVMFAQPQQAGSVMFAQPQQAGSVMFAQPQQAGSVMFAQPQQAGSVMFAQPQQFAQPQAVVVQSQPLVSMDDAPLNKNFASRACEEHAKRYSNSAYTSQSTGKKSQKKKKNSDDTKTAYPCIPDIKQHTASKVLQRRNDMMNDMKKTLKAMR